MFILAEKNTIHLSALIEQASQSLICQQGDIGETRYVAYIDEALHCINYLAFVYSGQEWLHINNEN